MTTKVHPARVRDVRIFGIIVGVLIALTGLPILLGGIGLVAWVGDGSGIEIPLKGFTAPPSAVAIVSPEFSINTNDLPSQVRDAAVILRIIPTAGDGPLFLGIAPATKINRYLRNASTARLETSGTQTNGENQPPDPQQALTDGVDVKLVLVPGKRKLVPAPTAMQFWTRSVLVDDAGEITLTPDDLSGKNARAVVMRADGKPGIAASATAYFRVPFLTTIGWYLLLIGFVVMGLGIGLILLIVLRKPKQPDDTTPGDPILTRPPISTRRRLQTRHSRLHRSTQRRRPSTPRRPQPMLRNQR